MFGQYRMNIKSILYIIALRQEETIGKYANYYTCPYTYKLARLDEVLNDYGPSNRERVIHDCLYWFVIE